MNASKRVSNVPKNLKDTHRWVLQSIYLFSFYHPRVPLHWIISLTNFSCDVLNVDLNVGPVDYKSDISSTESLATRNDMYVSQWHDKRPLHVSTDLASSIENRATREYTAVCVLRLDGSECSERPMETCRLPYSRIYSVRLKVLKV